MELSVRDTSFKGRQGQSGQAVIEYILGIMIVILIVFGSIYQFNDAFKVWANNYFGDYLSCLLETGELPAIGGTGGAASSCDGLYRAFSLAEGRPYDGGPGTSGGSSGGGGSDDDSSGEESSPEKGASEGGYSSGQTQGSGRGPGAGLDRDNRMNRQSGQGDEGAGGGSNRKIYTGSTEDSLPSGLLAGGRAGASQRRSQLDEGYFRTSDQKKEVKNERAPIKISETTRRERNQRMLVKRAPAEVKSDLSDEPMGFGDYFRYLLIAALIIALVIVIGGQLSQISQEME